MMRSTGYVQCVISEKGLHHFGLEGERGRGRGGGRGGGGGGGGGGEGGGRGRGGGRNCKASQCDVI